MRKKIELGFFILVMIVLLTACNKDSLNVGIPPAITDNLVTQSEKEQNLSVFTAAVKAAGLDSTLNQYYGSYTIFAPTDQAFSAIGINAANIVTQVGGINNLRGVLKYHILAGRINKSDFLVGPNARYLSLNSDSLFVTTVIGSNKSDIIINGVSTISDPNIRTTNGLIHKVNSVLLPPQSLTLDSVIRKNPLLTYLSAAINRAGFKSTLISNRFTVFAPSNQAFINAGFTTTTAIDTASVATLQTILRNHLLNKRLYELDINPATPERTVQGSNLTFSLTGGRKVKGASNTDFGNITQTNIAARNGIIHLVDLVLTP